MITEFNSADKDFSSRTNRLYLRYVFLLPTLGFWLVTLVYSIVYHEGRPRRTKLQRILEGLSYMSATSIIVSIIVLIVLAGAMVLCSSAYYDRREIVVGLKFNDALKELTIKTQTITGREYNRVHKYKDLSFYKDNLSDGMTSSYNTMTLAKGEELVGHVFIGHFTWSSETTSEIMAKVRNAK